MAQELCNACGEKFTGTSAGDMHRVGKHHIFTGPERRRCLTVDEMTARGMARNSAGVWMTRPRNQSEVATLAYCAMLNSLLFYAPLGAALLSGARNTGK